MSTCALSRYLLAVLFALVAASLTGGATAALAVGAVSAVALVASALRSRGRATTCAAGTWATPLAVRTRARRS